MPVVISKALPLKVPLIVWIDPTNICNFKCTFCPTGDDQLLKSVSRPKGMMKLEVFEKTINDLSLMVNKYNSRPLQISLYKDGEPLLNKNLPKMLKMASNAKLTNQLEVTTNGSGLTKKKSEELIKSGLQKIRFSIEHVHDEGYLKITQKPFVFKKIYENAKNFWHINKSLGEPVKVHIKIIDVNMTEKEKKLFFDLFEPIAHTTNIDNLHGWSDSSSKDFTLNVKPKKSVIGEKLIQKKVCSQPFSRVTVLFNGDVTPCCVDWTHKLVAGNIMKNSFDEIWNIFSNKLRIQHLKHEIPKSSPCFNCNYMLSYQEHELLDGEEDRIIKFYQN